MSLQFKENKLGFNNFDTTFLIIRTHYQKSIKLIAKIKLKKIFYTNIAVYYTKRVIQLINK